MADAWDVLTTHPLARTSRNYPPKYQLGSVVRNGVTFARWQYEPFLNGDARSWFYVDGQQTFLDQVHTHHTNQTKR